VTSLPSHTDIVLFVKIWVPRTGPVTMNKIQNKMRLGLHQLLKNLWLSRAENKTKLL